MLKLPRASRALGCSRLTRRRQLHTTEVVPDLEARGLLHQVTRRDKLMKLLETQQTVYLGVDPTAKALHIGHMLPLMCLLHFQLRGHRIIPLIGGATARIGDPSGRSQERKLLDEGLVLQNAAALTTCVTNFFKRALEHAEQKRFVADHKPWVHVMDNLAWYKDLSLLEFLRVAGTSARVNAMLRRESVQSRLDCHHGISFTEFSYQLLQAYDFYKLYKQEGCTVQVGGSDQWGNIVAGVELIAHLDDPAARSEDAPKGYGLTTPLLVNSQGLKMGKSEGNAMWLDPLMTSPFEFFQFFLKTSDEDVGKYLKMFTLLSLDRIEDEVRRHTEKPEDRTAQLLLAEEITEMIHGTRATELARIATAVLFHSDYSKIDAKDLIEALRGDPRLTLCAGEEVVGKRLSILAVAHGLAPSHAAAKTLISQGGLYLNNTRVRDIGTRLDRTQLLVDRIAILRAGRDNIAVLCLQ